MNKSTKLCALLTLLALAAPANAQLRFGTQNDLNAPITITADQLTWQQGTPIAYFNKNVTTTQGALTLQSQQMTLFYKNNQMDKLEFIGNVIMQSQNNTDNMKAIAKRATYDFTTQTINMYEQVRISTNENVILNGATLMIDLKSGNGILKSQTQKNRVRGRFIP